MKRGLAAVFALTVVGAGCVDHDLNARQFCDAHAALLSVERDREQVALPSDALNDIEDEIEDTMRDAEDGTRPVRRAARNLVAAYDDLAALVDDDEAEADELADARDELLEARAGTRAACARVD